MQISARLPFFLANVTLWVRLETQNDRNFDSLFIPLLHYYKQLTNKYYLI